MKIGISCNGEGFGHIARMVAIFQFLSPRHKLHFFCPPSVHSFVSENLPAVSVIPIPFLRFVRRNDKIHYYASIKKNLHTFTSFPSAIRRIRNYIVKHELDALICDFEPLLPRAARPLGIPVLQLNHPGVVLQSPSMAPDALLAKLVALFMMGQYRKKILSSFYNGSVGPIIRRQIREVVPEREDFYLIYLKGSYRRLMVKKLKKLGITNYMLFPNSKKDFVRALASCKGIIANAGHQIISEAIFLKKPILVLPLGGQHEQFLNAQMLEHSGWGLKAASKNIEERLPYFIENIDSFPRPRQVGNIDFNFNDSTEKAVELIDKFLDGICEKAPSAEAC